MCFFTFILHASVFILHASVFLNYLTLHGLLRPALLSAIAPVICGIEYDIATSAGLIKKIAVVYCRYV